MKQSESPAHSPAEGETPEGPFAALGIDPAIVTAIERLGFEAPTPIQAASAPVLLAGRDMIGRARTGSGKTAAFGLPLLHCLREGGQPVRGLVLAPTRELALQVTEALRSFAKDLPVRIATVYGGAPYPPQIRALQTATIVVGTPGRLLDHLGRGTLSLAGVSFVVIDEADEMLRLGFIDDVEALLGATPEGRQVALFSATMPTEIRTIAEAHLREPEVVQVEDRAMTVDHIDQQAMVVPRRHKVEALVRVLAGTAHDAVLVFARTKAGCAEVADELTRRGLSVDALHGDLSQPARERVVARLRARRLDIVVATDVAARGLDVDHVSHVVNFDLPVDTETYVHRIGRTGRVGRQGTAISFVTPNERRKVGRLARELRATIMRTEVPSDAAIAKRRQAALGEQLLGALPAEPAEASAVEDWLERLAQEQGLSTKQLALAAVRLLAEASGTPLAAIAEEAAPPFAQRRAPSHGTSAASASSAASAASAEGASEPRTEDTNEVRLFLPVGRRDHVRPADLVGALANEAEIDGRRIGRVDILDRKAFVGVPREVAEDILARRAHIQIRGSDVPLALARPGSGPPPRHSSRGSSREPSSESSRGKSSRSGGPSRGRGSDGGRGRPRVRRP